MGQFDVTGNLEVSLLPQFVFKLWSAAGLYVGPRLYIGGELGLADPSVTITAPQPNQVFKIDQEIPLNANVDGGIRLSLYTGLDLTAGIAGLDPEPCNTSSKNTSSPQSPACSNPCNYSKRCINEFWPNDGLSSWATVQGPQNGCKLPSLPVTQLKCYSHYVNVQARRDCYDPSPESKFQSHHIVQDAAVKGLQCARRYGRGSAPSVLLGGGDGFPGTPHKCANDYQDSTDRRNGGTIQSELDLGFETLIEANYSSRSSPACNRQVIDDPSIIFQVETCAKNYFLNTLGCSLNTNTNPVGN